MVISWAPGEQDTIDLLIKPQRGLTQKLLYHATNGHFINPVVIFSGPHGADIAMDEYESVLMIASGFGITAHLSSLKKLIHGYNARLVRTRRIRLVWQMRDKADGAAAQSFLNSALQEDKLDDGCILSISIHLESHDIPVIPFGKRAAVFPGTANLEQIFLEEVSGEHIKKPEIELDQKTTSAIERWESEKLSLEPQDLESGSSKTTARDGKMLVTVSSNDEIRDQVRTLVRDYIQDRVSLVELDYQPK
jgi:ferredoxin-NADP reductase